MKHQEKKISKDIPKDDINLLEKGRNPREHQESWNSVEDELRRIFEIISRLEFEDEFFISGEEL